MYWVVSDIPQTKTLVIPYYVPGEQLDFSAQLVVETGEVFERSYLALTDPTFLGSISVAIDPESGVFLDIGCAPDAEAFTGTLIGPCERSMTFRIELPPGFPGGEYALPLILVHGDQASGLHNTCFSGASDESDFPLWGDAEPDNPLWNLGYGPAPYWESGSICGRKIYEYAVPGETLALHQLVWIDRSGGTPVAKLARADQGLAQATVFGIVDDISNPELVRVLCQGFITDASWNLTVGQQQYLTSTPGAFSHIRPASGRRTIIGEAVSSHTICFSPIPPGYNWVKWAGSAIATDWNTYLWEFGGNDGSGITNRLRVLNFGTMQWSNLTSGCTARTGAGMVFNYGYLYIFGGQDSDGNYLNTICVYDVTHNVWLDMIETSMSGILNPVLIVDLLPDGMYWGGFWAEGMEFDVGAVTLIDGVYYVCIKANIAELSNEPGIGVDWQTYWKVIDLTLPNINIIGGITTGGPNTGTWIFNPGTGLWTQGPLAPSGFGTDIATTTPAFEDGIEVALATNPYSNNNIICGGGAPPPF